MENNNDGQTIPLNLSEVNEIQHILDSAYKTLGNPIRLLDNNYNLLLSSDNNTTDDPLWNELKANGRFSHETVHFLITELLIDRIATANEITLLSHNKLKYDRIIGRVYNKNKEQLGHITVAASYKPFKPGDIELVKKICESVSYKTEISDFIKNTGHSQHEIAIENLIEGRMHDKAIDKTTMEYLYENLRDNLYIAVVDIIQYEHTLTHLTYFQYLFSNIQNEYKYFIYFNNIVILISTDDSMLSINKDLRKLNDFFASYNIFAGISSSFQNLYEAKKHYIQALNALNYGLEDNNNQHIFIYNEYKIYPYIKRFGDRPDTKEALCNPIVFLISDHDKKHRTSYYNIMRTYLMFGCNPELASEKLEIGKNELQTQLAEMEDIFDINWNNGNTILSLLLTIKIQEYF